MCLATVRGAPAFRGLEGRRHQKWISNKAEMAMTQSNRDRFHRRYGIKDGYGIKNGDVKSPLLMLKTRSRLAGGHPRFFSLLSSDFRLLTSNFSPLVTALRETAPSPSSSKQVRFPSDLSRECWWSPRSGGRCPETPSGRQSTKPWSARWRERRGLPPPHI